MKSKEGRVKAFSTVHPAFCLFRYSTGPFFMYIRPNLLEGADKNIPAAILFTIVVPLLNPFIYNPRNKKITNGLRKILRKKGSQGNLKKTASTVA